MTFLARIRPWQTIKAYERMVAAMDSICVMKDETIATQKEVIEKITAKHVEEMNLKAEQIKFATDLLRMQNEKVAALSARPEVTGFQNLPTAEELEREVNRFFARQPISVCQQAIEGAPSSEIAPQEVKTVARVLTRLWRQGAMNRLSQPQDASK